LSVESVGMTDVDRDVVERTLTSKESLCFMYNPETELSESKNAKIAGENNIVFLYNKGICLEDRQ
jgi:Pyruvate/2-oxoacid:ferredoxin oxidoreductase delta subunit